MHCCDVNTLRRMDKLYADIFMHAERMPLPQSFTLVLIVLKIALMIGGRSYVRKTVWLEMKIEILKCNSKLIVVSLLNILC